MNGDMNPPPLPWMEPGVSYAVGIAHLYIPASGVPEVLLVLQRPGEAFAQQDGGTHTRDRVWKMPIGRLDLTRDRTLDDTGKIEFWQETGRILPDLSAELSKKFRMKSQRPGSLYHEDVYFLVVKGSRIEMDPKAVLDKEVEAAEYFPLDQLPNGNAINDRGARIAGGHVWKLRDILLEVGHKAGLPYDIRALF